MFKAQFTSSQGVDHAEAIFVVLHVNSSENKSSSTVYSLADGTYSTTGNSNKQLNFKAVYWADQAAFDAGFDPYILTPAGIEGDLWFYVDVTDNSGSTLTDVELAEKHLQDKFNLTPIVP